jgi:hypothetical protein
MVPIVMKNRYSCAADKAMRARILLGSRAGVI